jgi:hypothetical protein
MHVPDTRVPTATAPYFVYFPAELLLLTPISLTRKFKKPAWF